MKHSGQSRRLTSRVVWAPAVVAMLAGMAPAGAQIDRPDKPILLQWFETKWTDMERRVPDWFAAGYDAVWLPPVSRGYVDPRNSNQNGDSAGYDPFDRFDLGKPGAETAYGTEARFGAARDELQLANGLVYVDMVLNHNAGRQTSVQFQQDGGYPGFWMAPGAPITAKTATSAWGDFHGGTGAGYYQSEDPGGARYCLHAGDLVSLIDIDHALNNLFIRQPVAVNPQNIPGGTYFNKVNADNARFYFDTALGTEGVANPGMFSPAGELNTSPHGAFPCNVPARNEPASGYTRGRFNLNNPLAGDAVAENATGYLLRWTQWMLDVQKVDGFRIDAIKHMPSWFYDTYYDSVVYQKRTTPDGRQVTPYSFGESVEGNDFTFQRYVRMPNGATSGRSTAGDAFGNRDALDLGGAGALRDLINGFQSWSGVQGTHLDNADDGFNNGTIGVNHSFSHDNGSTGNGGSQPGIPTYQQQGWFAHAYLIMRPGVTKLYHNGRGISRGGGFWPREGLPVALGWDPTAAATQSVITNLVQLRHFYARGDYIPRWQDSFVNIFDRRTGSSSNVLVGTNRSYAGSGVTSYDERTVATNFPSGQRLIEMTGNAARSDVDPSGQIAEVLTVASGGNVTIRVPRNQNFNGVTHHRGFVVYGPAIPSGTVTLVGSTGTIAADPASTPDVRQRVTALPIVSGNTFEVRLDTTNGDPGLVALVGQAAANANADDNAVFRINEGFTDLNGNGGVDKPFNDPVVPGYENFVTQKTPMAGTSLTGGVYRQTINTATLPEGVNYLSVIAFRKRNSGEAALYREWRVPFYVDRVAPSADITNCPLTLPTPQSYNFQVRANDRTTRTAHVIVNLPVGGTITPNLFNQATQTDRFDFNRTASLVNGTNRVTLVAVEESGTWLVKDYYVIVGSCPADLNGDGFVDDSDFVIFASAYDNFEDYRGDFNNDGYTDDADFVIFAGAYDAFTCP